MRQSFISKSYLFRGKILRHTVVDELVEFDEEMPALGDADWATLVVVFRSKVDTDNCVGNLLFAVNVDLVLEGVMVQPLEVCLDMLLNIFLLLLCGLARLLNSNGVEVDEVVSEEGDKLANINVLDGNTGEDEVVVLVGRQRLLVLLVEFHHFLVQLVEGWVVNSGLSKFKSRWSVVPYVFDFRGIAKEFASYSLETSVVPV